MFKFLLARCLLSVAQGEVPEVLKAHCFGRSAPTSRITAIPKNIVAHYIDAPNIRLTYGGRLLPEVGVTN